MSAPDRSGRLLVRKGASIAFALGWLVPLAILLLASFADSGPTLAGFEFALDRQGGDLWGGFVDSLLVALPSTALALALAAPAAYFFALTPFRHRDLVVVALGVLALVPRQVYLVPLAELLADQSIMARPTGYLGLSLVHASLALPVVAAGLTIAIARIPPVLVQEPAGGAGHLQMLGRVVVPRVAPALVAAGIFVFLRTWNDFFVTVALTAGADDAPRPLTVGLVRLVEAHGDARHLVAAGAVVTAIIPVAVYVSLRRRFVAAVQYQGEPYESVVRSESDC